MISLPNVHYANISVFLERELESYSCIILSEALYPIVDITIVIKPIEISFGANCWLIKTGIVIPVVPKMT